MRTSKIALAAIAAAALMMPATAQAEQVGEGTTDVCIIQEVGKPAAPQSAGSASPAAQATPKTGDASAVPAYAVVAAAAAAASVAAFSKGAERRERS